jgi:basic membrane lipoprotein Med (substrate-binding protein (PBP1-ABC) superfamily)
MNQHPEQAAREGASIIVVLTFEFYAFLTKVSAEFPDVQFLNVDQLYLPKELNMSIRARLFQ